MVSEQPDTTVSASTSRDAMYGGASSDSGGGAEAIVIRRAGNGGFVAESMSKQGMSSPQAFEHYYDLEQWVGEQFGVSPDQMSEGSQGESEASPDQSADSAESAGAPSGGGSDDESAESAPDDEAAEGENSDEAGS